MRIGIEAQRIFRKNKHGMDYVVLQEIKDLQKIDKNNEYFVFVAPGEDVWSPDSGLITFTVDFNQMANNDGRYLQGNGHGVILCNHGGGHQIQLNEQSAAALIKFLKEHPMTAQPSPYAEDMPQTFVDLNCVFQH